MKLYENKLKSTINAKRQKKGGNKEQRERERKKNKE
jgi:hypothetical protein